MSLSDQLIDSIINGKTPEIRHRALAHWLCLYKSETIEEQQRLDRIKDDNHQQTIQQLTNVISKLTTLVIHAANTESEKQKQEPEI